MTAAPAPDRSPAVTTDLTLPEPNIPLLRKAVEWAEAEAAKPADQRLWNQEDWATQTDCGTAYCIAGFTVAVALPQAEMREDEWGYFDLYIDGEHVLWGETAGAVLGITGEERSALFAAGNDIEAVRAAAEQIAARAGERL